MAVDLERIRRGLSADGETARLEAARALEQRVRAELEAGPGAGRGPEPEAGRGEWDRLAERLLPILIPALGDDSKGVQVHTANSLELLAGRSDRVVPALRAALADPASLKAWGAALLLARMAVWMPELGPTLSAAMGAGDRDIRWAAAESARRLGESHPKAVEMVKESLGSANPLARKMAAYCLGAMGGYAEVERALAKALDDPEGAVRRAAIVAIGRLPDPSALVRQRVAELRQDPDPFVQRTAVAVAERLGR